MTTVAELLQAGKHHHQAGQLGPAEQAYRQVLQADPRHAEAMHLLGLIAHQVGRPDVAVRYMTDALNIDDRQPSFHNNLGEVYRTAGQFEPARACYERALRLNGRFAPAYYNLGLIEQSLRHNAAAQALYEQAIRLHPQYAEAHNNLGLILSEQGKLTEALAEYQASLRCRPHYVEALNNSAAALGELGRAAEAVQLLRLSLELKPDSAEAHYNLGNVYRGMKRLDQAADCYRQAMRVRPSYVEPICNMGTLCTVRGEDDEALQYFDQALRVQPLDARTHYNRGRLLLKLGRLAEGWQEYEWRLKLQAPAAHRRQRVWDGEPLSGQRILVYAEWGFGDTMHFVRYLPLVEERGGQVVLEVQKPLIPLLAQSNFKELIPMGETPAPDCAFQVPILSLPRIFGTTLETIPARIPYLSVDEERIERWRRRMAEIEGFKVGICWHGSPESSFDWRSLRLMQFESLAHVPGVQLISLQKGEGSGQVAEANKHFSVIDFGDELDSTGAFLDSAAILRSLDLVITIDTAVAHLAGALGAPVWMVTLHAPEWRWLKDRLDSPWYPTMRLFRQKRLDDWEPVFAEMAEALQGLVTGAADGQRR